MLRVEVLGLWILRDDGFGVKGENSVGFEVSGIKIYGRTLKL